MSSTNEFDMRGRLGTIVPNVFSTMASVAATPQEGAVEKHNKERVSGTIGIAGETVTGAVYVHLPDGFARQIANAILGNPPDQAVADGDLNDVVGELTNMVGGGLKSALCDAGLRCAMSTPSVIRGAFAIDVPNALRPEILQFSCQGQTFFVEAHLKCA